MKSERIEEIKQLCKEYKEGEKNVPPRITEGDWERFENYVVKSDWTPPLAFGDASPLHSAYFIECARKIDAEFCAQAKGVIRELLFEVEMITEQRDFNGRLASELQDKISEMQKTRVHHLEGCPCFACVENKKLTEEIRKFKSVATELRLEGERWKKNSEEWKSIATKRIEMFDQVMDILDPR